MSVKVRVSTVVECVSKITRIPVEDFYVDNRKRHVAMARFAVFKVCHEYGYAKKEISRQLGNRDHTSVMHGIAQAEKFEQDKPGFRMLITSLRKYVEQIASGPHIQVTPVAPKVVEKLMKPEPPKPDRTQHERFVHRGIVSGSRKLAQATIAAGGYK